MGFCVTSVLGALTSLGNNSTRGIVSGLITPPTDGLESGEPERTGGDMGREALSVLNVVLFLWCLFFWSNVSLA